MSTTHRSTLYTLALLLALAPLAWAAGNLSDANRWAWSENAGWLNQKPATSGGVTVHATHLSGFAWAENVGWVKLGADGAGPYGNTSAVDWGVNRDAAGHLSGYAWSENAGWVNFGATGGAAAVDEVSGAFSGYVWAENLGWAHLANLSPAYGVQLVVPQLPSSVSSDPAAEVWSSDTTVQVTWSGATGNDLGLGYSFLFDELPGTAPDLDVDLAHTADPHATTSAPLPDGDSHYFHLASCDPVGNCSPTRHVGPFWLDATPPRVAAVQSVSDTGDGQLADGEATSASITQLYVGFDEQVADPAGDTEPEDVTNPANYLVVAAGANGVVETTSCTAGPAGDDQAVVVDQVTYDAPVSTARLGLASGFQLGRGRYRALVCGSTSIVDRAGNPLDGDGNGSGGDDHRLDWAVSVTNLLVNPNLDQDLGGWTVSSAGEVVWGPDDAGQAPTSGSVEVTNLSGVSAIFTASQCVAVTGGRGYFMGGKLWVESGLAEAPGVSGQVAWYAASGCGGTLLDYGVTAPRFGGTGSVWAPLGGWVLAPAGAVSAQVTWVLDAGALAEMVANLDDLQLYEMLFGSGFEWGDETGWSSAMP